MQPILFVQKPIWSLNSPGKEYYLRVFLKCGCCLLALPPRPGAPFSSVCSVGTVPVMIRGILGLISCVPSARAKAVCHAFCPWPLRGPRPGMTIPINVHRYWPRIPTMSPGLIFARKAIRGNEAVLAIALQRRLG